MFGGGVIVLHTLCVAGRAAQNIGCRLRKADLHVCTLDLGAAGQLVLQIGEQRAHAAGDARDDGRDHSLVLAQQRKQQVRRLDVLVVVIPRDLLSLEDGLL